MKSVAHISSPPSSSISETPPRRPFAAGLEAIQSLFLYGAAGLVAFGSYLNSTLGVSSGIYPLFWAAGGLLVYNLDRLIPDPADSINLPERSEFQTARKWLIALSLLPLLAAPIYLKQWKLLGLLIAATLASSLYCLAPPGTTRRIKDFFWLKWLMPPTVVLITLTAPLWIEPKNWPRILENWPLLTGIYAALLINILLFDQRDILGDTLSGVKTIASRLTAKNLFRLLTLLSLVQISCLALDFRSELAVFAIYIFSLVALSRKKRPATFYHWAVDGMLFIPLACRWLVHGK